LQGPDRARHVGERTDRQDVAAHELEADDRGSRRGGQPAREARQPVGAVEVAVTTDGGPVDRSVTTDADGRGYAEQLGHPCGVPPGGRRRDVAGAGHDGADRGVGVTGEDRQRDGVVDPWVTGHDPPWCVHAAIVSRELMSLGG
jgi:hypothetical protein